MNLMDALNGRRSVRRYQRRPVQREMISALIDAAEAAPSAGNLRGRKYIVVSDEGTRRALAMAAYGQRHVMEAPVLIVVCADVRRSSSRYGDRGSLYAIQDAAAASMCLLLAAHGMGLGTCWTGAFDDDLVRSSLSLDDGTLPSVLISLGYPAESPSPAPRRDSAGMVRWIE